MLARVMVLVNVIDINDNVLLIDIRYIINLINGIVVFLENVLFNIKIVFIIVIDKDVDYNGRVICFIDYEVFFRLRLVFSNQFFLEIVVYFDYEFIREYVIKLLVVDVGKFFLN